MGENKMTKPSEKLVEEIYSSGRLIFEDMDYAKAEIIAQKILTLDPNEICEVRNITRKSKHGEYDVIVHSVVWKEGE